MVKLGMFVYPWDMAKAPERLLGEYADLGCNMIAVNGVYHQCNVLETRTWHVYERRNAGTSFAIHPEKYGRLRPRAEADLTQTYADLREMCEKKGIEWRCWMVNLHNDQVGDQWPDTNVYNVWGDRYPSALCVNHPDVRQYASALLEDVIATIAPRHVVMETESWMQAFHGRHHEFMLPRMTPAVQYLLSMCFCPYCMEQAQKDGVDAEKARALVDRLLKQLLAGDTTFGDNEHTQVIQLLLEYPELYAYQRFRMRSVTRLVKQTSETAHAHGIKYDYIPSAAPFPINEMHFEGSCLGELAPYVDSFVPLCYTPNQTYSMIRKNVDLFAPQTPVALAQNLSRARYAGRDAFVGKVLDAAQNGAQDIYSYCYTMATDECLSWVKQAYGLALEKEREKA